MATLTGKITDVAGRTPESISRITVKAPSARIGGGSDIIVTSPAEVTFDKTTGDTTISGLHVGLSWLYIEGDGWSDSVPLAVAEGFQLILEAVANASGVPGIADYVAMIRNSEDHARLLARAAVDGEIGEVVRLAQAAAKTAAQEATTADARATSADARATSAETKAGNAVSRVEELEAMAGVSPESPVDGQTANLITQPETLTSSAVDERAHAVARSEKLMVNIDPADFGAIPLNDASGAGADSTDALFAAIEHARSIRDPQGRDVSRRITINAWYKFNRDIIIDDISGLEIVGEGGNSGLMGVNAGIKIGSTTRILNRPTLRNIRVRRVTTSGNEHGIALHIAGGGMNRGGYPVRWALDHVEVESPIQPAGIKPEQSIALKLEGTFLATCTALYLRNAHTGLVIDRDSVYENLAANAITFTGGEIQGVRHIGRITGAIGIAFFGMAWEGATEGGMDVNRTQGLTIQGVYWERNSNYDLRLGEEGGVSGIAITGGISSPGGISALPEKDTKRSIIVRRARGLSISGIRFLSYEISPVIVDQASTNAIHGGLSHCSHSRLTIPVEEVVLASSWNELDVTNLTVGEPGDIQTSVRITGDDGTQRGIDVQTGDSSRWFAGANALSETGDNAGSEFDVIAYSDTGAYLGTAMTLYRSSQTVRMWAKLRVDGGFEHNGDAVGFFGAAPTSKPEVTGSRSDGTALKSLLTALVKLGLVTDQTTA